MEGPAWIDAPEGAPAFAGIGNWPVSKYEFGRAADSRLAVVRRLE